MKKARRNDTKNERDRPDFWVTKMQETVDRNQVGLQQYVTFSRWATGDMRELKDPYVSFPTEMEAREGLANHHALVQETARANLFFRNPQAVVRCPWSRPSGVFTQGLARVETALTIDTLEQCGYFIRARRRLDDALNGPYGILKITHEVDVAIDKETIDEARAEAQMENRLFVTPPHQKMKAVEDQIHSLHIEEHEKLYAMGQRGEVLMTKSALKYIRDHINVHHSMRKTEAPTETVRDASVVVRRKNPLDWFYDTTVDDMGDCRWFAEQYLVRKIDVLANDDFDKEALDALARSTLRYSRQEIPYPTGIPETGPFRGSDELVRICEVIDLVDGVVREFAEGSQEMLRVRPYGMKSIMPSGPYSILMFRQNPFEATGVAIPSTWAQEQRLLTSLASMHATAAERAIPRTAYNADILQPEKVSALLNAPSCDSVPLNGIPRDMKLKDLLEQIPAAQIQDTSLLIENVARGRINTLSGFGGQKLGGGDKADSATEAAIIAGNSDAISEDRAAMLDRASENDVRMIVRIQRSTYPKDRVIETVGEEAMKWWPDVWAERDIVNDRGATIITGSSRRRNTQIDTKLMMDFVTGIAGLPPFQGPTGQSMIVEMSRRIVEDNGISGLDWEALKMETEAMAAMAQQMAMGGGVPPEDREGGSAEETGEEPSQAAMQQGMANVGGGRVATGAGEGDNFRFVRGKV